jgi:Zn finger protein HypA/HybF involved in hydrogenase expression
MYMRVRRSLIWSIPKEKLQELINQSLSIVDVLRKLNYDGYNGNHKTLRQRILLDKLDLSQLKNNRLKRYKSPPNKLSNSEIFCANSSYRSNKGLKYKILKHQLIEYKCKCGLIGIWNGDPLSLQLDHINGKNDDNRLENLRFLCPNCHSQTDTFAGKKNKGPERACKLCQAKISKNASLCLRCSNSLPEHHPTKFTSCVDELSKLLTEFKSFKAVAKHCKVSDTSIRKRCQKLKLPFKSGDLKKWLTI